MGIARHVLLPSAIAVTVLLSACGGGGGGSTATTTNTVTLTPASQFSGLTSTDTYTLSDLKGLLGAWDGAGGGGADSGGADAGGAAGDGEFVKVTINLPGSSSTTQAGTLTWKILRSAYGLENRTGTMNLQTDLTSGVGGYRVTSGGGVKQSNIYVSNSGQISGSLPLPVNGGTDSVFNAVRFKDVAVASFTPFIGTYSYATITSTKTTGANPSVGFGVFKIIDSAGKSRSCPDTMAWSATCANGLDMQGSFDSSDKNLLRFVHTASQATSISSNYSSQVDLIAVAKSFTRPQNGTTGISFTGDFVTVVGTTLRTGAVYGALQEGSILAANDLIGQWSVAIKDTSAFPSPSFGRTLYTVIGNVSGQVKFNTSTTTTGTTCSPVTNVTGVSQVTNSSGAVIPGVLKHVDTSGTGFTSYFIQTDANAFVIAGNQTFGISRKANLPTLATNCPPQ